MQPKMKIGLWLLVAGVALPLVTFVGAHSVMAYIASLGGPPDQGAMLLAFITLLFSAAIGGCLAVAGLVLVFRGRDW